MNHERRLFLTLALVFSSIVIVAYAFKVGRISSLEASNPANRDAHLRLGLALHQQGRTDDALREYKAAAAVDPTSAIAFYDIGTAEYDRKQIDAAVQAYSRAITLEPRHADAQFNLGYIQLHDRKDAAAALTPLNAAAQANPRMAKAYYELGLAYEALKAMDRANTAWDAAIRIDPGYRILVDAHPGRSRQ